MDDLTTNLFFILIAIYFVETFIDGIVTPWEVICCILWGTMIIYTAALSDTWPNEPDYT